MDRIATPTSPLITGELPELAARSAPPRRRPFRFTLKLLAMCAATYFFVLPLIPGFRSAWTELQRVRPALLIVGLLLELAAFFCYATNAWKSCEPRDANGCLR